jgi:hypothetical protein
MVDSSVVENVERADVWVFLGLESYGGEYTGERGEAMEEDVGWIGGIKRWRKDGGFKRGKGSPGSET